MDINELLASAKLAEDEVLVCLRPDLLAQYKTAITALESATAEHKRAGSLDAVGKLSAQAEVDELREQMLAASVRFTVRALPQRRWTALYAEHPPREGDIDDTRTGFNRDTFYPALVRECVVDPALTPQQWDALLNKLSAAQFASLRMSAWTVNSSDVDVPFLLAASRAPTSTDPGSEPLGASESLSSDSTAGSPPPPTSTAMTGGSRSGAAKANGTANSRT